MPTASLLLRDQRRDHGGASVPPQALIWTNLAALRSALAPCRWSVWIQSFALRLGLPRFPVGPYCRRLRRRRRILGRISKFQAALRGNRRGRRGPADPKRLSFRQRRHRRRASRRIGVGPVLQDFQSREPQNLELTRLHGTSLLRFTAANSCRGGVANVGCWTVGKIGLNGAAARSRAGLVADKPATPAIRTATTIEPTSCRRATARMPSTDSSTPAIASSHWRHSELSRDGRSIQALPTLSSASTRRRQTARREYRAFISILFGGYSKNG